MPDKFEAFVEVVLLKTAFLGGLWSYIEMNPQRYALLEMVRILRPYMEGPMMPDIDFIALFKFLFAMIFIAALLAAALFGSPKGIGLISFGLAFGAGYIVILQPEVGVLMLMLSVVLAMAIAETNDNTHQRKPPQPPI